MEEKKLVKYLSPLNVWALAIGCSMSWSAFILPSSTVIPLAGTIGTAVGYILGSAMILIIGLNYLALMKKFPDSGGAFSCIKNIFGYDQAFLNAWFLLLTYVAIIWANSSGLTMIVEGMFGNALEIGFSYKILGDEVFLGEIIFSSVVMIFLAWLCINRKTLAKNIQTILAVTFTSGIVLGAIAVTFHHEGGLESFKPYFNHNLDVAYQIFNVVALSSWAYVGFESIAHSHEEFDFPQTLVRSIVLGSIATILVLYALLGEISVSIFPNRYSSWDAYFNDLPWLEGVENIPTFYAVSQAMGSFGIRLFEVAALGIVITGIIGGYIAASRLVFAVARDDVIPKWFGKLSDDGTPRNAIKFVCILSLFEAVVGKTFNSWTIDLLSISAGFVYTYISGAAYRVAKDENNLRGQIFGIIGLVFSMTFLACLLIPNVLAILTIKTGSYLILCLFGISGFLISSRLLKKDRLKRFGKSIIVYVAMLFLIFFSSLMWMRQSADRAAEFATINLQNFYHRTIIYYGIHRDRISQGLDLKNIDEIFSGVKDTIHLHIELQMIVISLGLAVMFSIYMTTKHRKEVSERRREQLKLRNEELEQFASVDQLTGLTNKRASEENLSRICLESHGALLIIDLDSFKLVNDLHGHAMGDEILIAFAEIIRDIFEPSDFEGRLGGDEFIVFCYDLLDEDQIAQKARSINSRILEEAKRLMGEDMNIPLGASLGGVLVPLDGRDFVDLFKKADRALYSVKQAGKHGFKFFTESMSEVEIENSLLSIEMILSERNQSESARVLSFEDFKTIYRHLKRKNSSGCILLITLSDPNATDELVALLQSTLKQSDSIMQGAQSQIMILLSDVEIEDVDKIVEQIQKISPVELKFESNSIK